MELVIPNSGDEVMARRGSDGSEGGSWSWQRHGVALAGIGGGVVSALVSDSVGGKVGRRQIAAIR